MKTIITLMLLMFISGAVSARFYYSTAIETHKQFEILVWNMGVEALESQKEDKRLATLYKAGLAAGAEIKKGGRNG